MGEWTDVYQGVTATGADQGIIPLMGVRMLVGINGNGENVFFVKVDGHEDNVMAVFLLDLAADAIRAQARSTYKGIAREDAA